MSDRLPNNATITNYSKDPPKGTHQRNSSKEQGTCPRTPSKDLVKWNTLFLKSRGVTKNFYFSALTTFLRFKHQIFLNLHHTNKKRGISKNLWENILLCKSTYKYLGKMICGVKKSFFFQWHPGINKKLPYLLNLNS